MQFLPETEDQSALRKLAREVADRELAPRAAHWDETEEFPHDSWRAIAEAGLFRVTVGEESGGAGAADVESACLVWTRFPGSAGPKGIGSVIVDLQRDGVKVTSIHKKMGLRGCAEAELAFDGVRVEQDDVLLRGEPENTNAFRTLLSHL